MAEQQQQQQIQFANLLENLGEQMAGLSTTMGAQGVAKIITPFDGDGKNFKEWIKNIEKYSLLTRVPNDQVKMVAYQSSKGPVSDFLKRYLEANPQHTWLQVKTELTARFSEVTDPQHALMLLRKVKQRQGENVQVYAERLLNLAEDAFVGQAGAAIDQQLVGFFIDGLTYDYMKMKVMRDNPATLQDAITVATNEQNLRKRFDLRSGNRSSMDKGSAIDNFGPESMEVDHFRRQTRCYICNRKGHKAKDCRQKQQAVNAVSYRPKQSYITVVCWHCQKRGHFARDCKAKKVNSDHTGNRPGQAASCGDQGN